VVKIKKLAVLLSASTFALDISANSLRTKVIPHSDANNELDDQLAIAYQLFKGDYFEVPAITVNRTCKMLHRRRFTILLNIGLVLG